MTSAQRERVRVVPVDDADAARLAARALRSGDVVAIPTDTVYGLAAAIDCPNAIDRLFALKGRPADKAIPILLSDFAHLPQVTTGLTQAARCLALSFWPGALTLVVPALPELAPQLTAIGEDGCQTVAVRVPDHPAARAIIEAAGGALAVTSANWTGEAPALEAQDAASLGGSSPILVVDGGRVPVGVPSTIVLVAAGPPLILREGAISESAIAAALAQRQSAPAR